MPKLILKLFWSLILLTNYHAFEAKALSNSSRPSSLSFIDFSNNKLTGEVPSSICNLSNLQLLDLSNNGFSGVLPQCLGSFSKNLIKLNVANNSLRGTIPDTFTKGKSLKAIDFSRNHMEGTLPRSFANCRGLEVLNLGNNNISDTFPYWLETLPSLQVLVLRANRLHGTIESSKSKTPFSMLRVIDLSRNDFTGHFPGTYLSNFKAMRTMNEKKEGRQYVGDNYYLSSITLTLKGQEMKLEKILVTLTTIDFSCNNFTGEISEFIGELISLRGLNLSHNNITDQIPSGLGNLRLLETLDLSSNQLEGKIPTQLTRLTSLEVLNLSYNHLRGTIPRGKQFFTFENDSYIGNTDLCGSPLTKSCNVDEQHQILPQKDVGLSFASEFDFKVVLMGYAFGLAIGSFIGYVMFLKQKPKWLVEVIEGEISKLVTRKSSQRRRARRN